MTRKDYVKVAAALYCQRGEVAWKYGGDSGLEGALWIVDCIVRDVAEVFADDNPRFDHDRFYRACGLEV